MNQFALPSGVGCAGRRENVGLHGCGDKSKHEWGSGPHRVPIVARCVSPAYFLRAAGRSVQVPS